jgi:hypothetical protein
MSPGFPTQMRRLYRSRDTPHQFDTKLASWAWHSRLRGEMMLLKTDLTIKTNIQNFAAAALLLISASTISSSAQAFTCDDVRHLTSAEQNYYVKLLHISAVQRHQIWTACYRNYRPGLQAQLVQR